MKVTVITSRYPTERHAYNHMFVHTRCLEMMKLGVDIEVFVPNQTSSYYSYEGVKVQKMPTSEMLEKIDKSSVIYLHLLNIYPFQKKDGWVVYRHIIKHRIPFVFYVHGNEVQKYSARKYEFDFRLSDLLKWMKKDLWVIPMMRKFVETANQGIYVFPSKWMKMEMEKNLNLKIDKFHILPNGIDSTLFKYLDMTENRYKIVTIRSLSQKVYDIEKTIEVMAHLPKKFTLDIYGKGVYENKYKNLIVEKGLSNRVRIIPSFFTKEEMKDLFKSYGVFISTTRMDSQGITMMESMASGLLVATTDNSSKKEFIDDGETGILGIQAKEIAKKIVRATENTDNFHRITKNARKQIDKISLEEVTPKEIAILKHYKNQIKC